MDKLTFRLLKDCPEAGPRLVEIWYETLGKVWTPDIRLEDVQGRFDNHHNETSLPLMVVALWEGKPVGMAALREDDGLHSDDKPWFGSLAVDPDFQNKGIGRRLAEEISDRARQLGFQEIFLLTFEESLTTYYGSMGFQRVGTDTSKGRPVIVMKKELARE